MTKYPIDRSCPISGTTNTRVLSYLPAAAIAAANPTYQMNFSEILGISPTDEFPIVEGPTGFVFAGWSPPNRFLTSVYEHVIDHSKTITETLGYRQYLLEFGSALLRIATGIHGSASKQLRLLDFGCGYGTLIRILASRDIRCYGYEPSSSRRVIASRDNLEILDDLNKVESAGPFDLFICTEVLEHVPDPRKVLKLLKRSAAPGALLALTVPQCEPAFIEESLASFSRGRALPRVINPWEHLNYFSAESIRALLAEEGFDVVSDFGQSKSLHSVSFGMSEVSNYSSRIRCGLRIAKRLFTSPRSTELICRSI